TTGVADVDTASFRRITDNLAQPEIRIDNPAAWRIALDSPGEELTFVAYAVDRAGNKSEEVKLNVIRRRLEIFPFEVVEKRGNVATVQGKLRFEGERVLEEGPDVGLDLRFMVNGTLADTAWVPAADGITSSPETVEGSAQGAIAFQATVLLGQAVNNVEVLYSWNGSKPRPFPKPVRHTNLRVDPPLILIDALPEVTNQSEISVSGHLEPYFDGLALQINTPIGFQRLPLDIAGRMAFFSRTVRLLRDQENEISFTVHYKDSQILGSSDHAYKVFCDMRSPTCQDVFLREEYADRMVLQVNASEGLSRLKGRITGGRRETGAVEPLESGALEDLAIDPVKATWEPVAYRVEVRQPYRSQSRIQLELTDLAGNTDTQEELILRAPDSLVSAAAVRRAIAEGGEGGEEPGSIQTAKASFRSGTIDFWSPFLEEMGMSFVPFGNQRLEMSEKEVPEFAWFRYLREIGESIGTPGERQVPMVLGDRPVNLVRGFVKWFEEQTDDGYAYFVPTVDQWVCAFAGRSDPVLAREEIAEWFSPDPDASRYARMGKCFTETPTPRYGLNKLQESGSRPANISPSGLLDMEANVQELVIQQEGGSLFFVIGGHEQLRTRSDFLSHCQTARRFGEDQQSLQTKFTGLRLCRRPKTEDDQPRP
ncbi:MAG: hypothetical protein JXA90_01655, partial [Planctomycetes bacterium]|nr:hypothetical protein [Planctomycetota bacterium]